MKDNRRVLGVFDFGKGMYAFLHGGFRLVNDEFVAHDGAIRTREQLMWRDLSQIEHLRDQVLAEDRPT